MSKSEKNSKLNLFSPRKDPIFIQADDLMGEELKKEISHQVHQVVSHAHDNQSFLKERSLRLNIIGGWGWGKTTVAYTFMNEMHRLKTPQMHPVLFEPYKLLSFGNINESIRYILSDMAESMMHREIVDIRKQVGTLITDATPALEVKTTFSFGPFSISRRLDYQTKVLNDKAILNSKFYKLAKEGFVFTVVLDDVDRLKPDEMVAVLRMVEVFEEIPGFLFILPFNKDVVAEGIKEALKLNSANATAFLRKFRDLQIVIKYKLDDLKQKFLEEFRTHRNVDGFRKVKGYFGLDLAELAWYILVHFAIVESALETLKSNPSADNVSRVYPKYEVSSYLFKIYSALNIASVQGANQLYVGTMNGQHISKVEVNLIGLREPQINSHRFIEQLDDLLNPAALSRRLYIGHLNKVEYSQDEIKSTNAQESGLFDGFLLPILKDSHNEPWILSSFSMRDMVQLAQMIACDKALKQNANPDALIRVLLGMIRTHLNDFK